MTDGPRPERPDFMPPPAPAPVASPAATGQAPRPARAAPGTGSLATSPVATFQQQDVLPPGPYKHARRPPRSARPVAGRGSVAMGLGVTLVLVSVAAWLSAAMPSIPPFVSPASGAVLVVPVALLVVGVVLLSIRRTARTGVGVLLGLALSVFAAGLLWVLLLLFGSAG